MLYTTKDLYTRSTLIWTWVPRLIICVILFALGVKDYVVLNNLIYSDSYYDDVRGALGRSFALIAGFTLGTILLDGVEALLYAKRKLNPIFYLVSNMAKLIIWAFYFVLAVIAMVWAESFALASIPAVLLVGFTFATFVYGCVVVHRWRRMRKAPQEWEQGQEVVQYS